MTVAYAVTTYELETGLDKKTVEQLSVTHYERQGLK